MCTSLPSSDFVASFKKSVRFPPFCITMWLRERIFFRSFFIPLCLIWQPRNCTNTRSFPQQVLRESTLSVRDKLTEAGKMPIVRRCFCCTMCASPARVVSHIFLVCRSCLWLLEPIKPDCDGWRVASLTDEIKRATGTPRTRTITIPTKVMGGD